MDKKLKIEIPRTPNFIRVKGLSREVIPLKDFSEKELKQIGKEWTEDLIKKAKNNDKI